MLIKIDFSLYYKNRYILRQYGGSRLTSNEPDGGVHDENAEDGHEGGETRGMRVIAFRDKLACADREEESAKNGKQHAEDFFGKSEEER